MKLLVAISVFLTLSCSGNGPHKGASENPAINPQALEQGYAKVKPIFAQYCSACHPSRSGPDWLDLNQAETYVANGKLLKRAVIDKSMPPPGSPQAASITDKERATIKNWITSSATSVAGPTTDGHVGAATQLVTTCFQCHGAEPGAVSQPRIPRLRGQNKAYLILQLEHFKWRDRVDPVETMNNVAYPLDQKDIEEVASYFASFLTSPNLKDPPPVPNDSQVLFKAGQRLADAQCISCHQNPATHGLPINDLLPILAGQSKQYLVNQLLSFRKPDSRSGLMHEYAKSLSNDDVEALATFFNLSP